MPLNLDLSSARAKAGRAQEHLDQLYGAIPEGTTPETAPFIYRTAGPVDRATGWCLIVREPQDPPWRQRVALIAGDVYHNLRCALNYVVAELADASGIDLDERHQFPIVNSRNWYRNWVGFPEPKEQGPLHHIRHGLTEIEACQPYADLPPSGPSDFPTDLLWHLREFSNRDKHRSVTLTMAKPLRGTIHTYPPALEWRPAGGRIWEPDAVQEVAEMRFAPPYPDEVNVFYTGEGAEVLLALPKLPGEEQSIGHNLGYLNAMSQRVSQIINWQFGSL